MTGRGRDSAFTLMELMVVVAILGVLAAIAIPSFVAYMRRARTSETVQNLNTMYGAASALFVWERATRGVTASVVTACVAEPTPITPSVPGRDKQQFVATGGFLQLAFRSPDYVYFGYGIASIGTPGQLSCFAGGLGATPTVYTFFANGDLDGDGILSTFELAVGSSEANQLYHSRGFYVVDELE
jgi:type IV pilus assembly protein PilA